MMRTYDDITTTDRAVIERPEDAEIIGALDLRREAETYARQQHTENALYLKAGAHNGEAVEVVYFPHHGRAGVAWGADAQWTDAESAEDALERSFGVGGKAMVE